MAAKKSQPTRAPKQKQPDPVIHVHYVHHFHHVQAAHPIMQPIMHPGMGPTAPIMSPPMTPQAEFIMGTMAPGFYAGTGEHGGGEADDE
jgi:hypothetical protein